jgi:hypothetical protein
MHLAYIHFGLLVFRRSASSQVVTVVYLSSCPILYRRCDSLAPQTLSAALGTLPEFSVLFTELNRLSPVNRCYISTDYCGLCH